VLPVSASEPLRIVSFLGSYVSLNRRKSKWKRQTKSLEVFGRIQVVLPAVHQSGDQRGNPLRFLQLARTIRSNLTHGLHYSQHGSLHNIFMYSYPDCGCSLGDNVSSSDSSLHVLHDDWPATTIDKDNISQSRICAFIFFIQLA
jgi:hypothetical protein